MRILIRSNPQNKSEKEQITMEKKTYISAEIQIIRFETEDIIATSGPQTGENELPIVPNG